MSTDGWREVVDAVGSQDSVLAARQGRGALVGRVGAGFGGGRRRAACVTSATDGRRLALRPDVVGKWDSDGASHRGAFGDGGV